MTIVIEIVDELHLAYRWLVGHMLTIYYAPTIGPSKPLAEARKPNLNSQVSPRFSGSPADDRLATDKLTCLPVIL